MKSNVSNDIFSKLNESVMDPSTKERLSDLAYKFCGEIANEDELEYVIEEMKWWLAERKRQVTEMNEEFYGGAEFAEEEKKPLSADELFTTWCDMESDIEDFAEKWNGCKGTPDEVRRQRIRLVNPTVIEFVSENEEDLRANWDKFEDIMTDNNFHTPLIAIEKELQKYE